ncbi:hypothetical protein [Mucilaginibacter gilvus]|uniref:Beta-lactamase-inhibitor-like PepSY-like domain-containing protein n=1 Tax=Mucilaginibacter gilvus TaxID=2305909 RepID=A0A444MRU2_9SPHI|nr:hypothetical protein [Mucilaginibacter gilvus]RWY54324.1 hypothetical protein EPL05_09825 [Mucilaginibacter gilvus]
MKKIFVIIAIAASLFTTNIYAATSATRTDDGTENVSYAAILKFNNDFARAENATWKVSPNFQKVTFTLDDVKMSAFYNLRGELIGVTQNVQFKALPEKAKKEIATKYEGYFAKEVIKLESGDDSFDNTVYFVDLAKDGKELLVRVTPSAGVYFFQNVK